MNISSIGIEQRFDIEADNSRRSPDKLCEANAYGYKLIKAAGTVNLINKADNSIDHNLNVSKLESNCHHLDKHEISEIDKIDAALNALLKKEKLLREEFEIILKYFGGDLLEQMPIASIGDDYKEYYKAAKALFQDGRQLRSFAKHITSELCEIACRQNGIALEFVPLSFKTRSLCSIACNQNLVAAQYFPEDMTEEQFNKLFFRKNINIFMDAFISVGSQQKTPEFYKLALRHNFKVFEYIPNSMINKEIFEIACQKNRNAIFHIADEMKTPLFWDIAFQNGLELCSIDEQKRTPELCDKAVKQNGMALDSVPLEMRTQELCENAVRQNGLALQFVPREMRTQELFNNAVRQNGLALELVSREMRTQELSDNAVKQNGLALELVSREMRTRELSGTAVRRNGLALEFVPREMRTQELFDSAVRQNGRALEFVPQEMRTPELCKCACLQNGEAIEFVPEEMRNMELCELACWKDIKASYYLPDTLKNNHQLCKMLSQNEHYSIEFNQSNTPESVELITIKYQHNYRILDSLQKEHLTRELLYSLYKKGINSDSLFTHFTHLQDDSYFIRALEDYASIGLKKQSKILSCDKLTDETKRRVLTTLYGANYTITRRIEPKRVISKADPLAERIYSPFAGELVINCYQARAFLPYEMDVARGLDNYIETSKQKMQPFDDSISLTISEISGGRTLKLPGVKHCLYVKLQREGESLSVLKREGLVHQFLDKENLRSSLKSQFPEFKAFYAIPLDKLPKQIEQFSDTLAISERNGRKFVNAYCYQASPAYSIYAHQPDTGAKDPYDRPEQGILKASYDLGRFLSMGILLTSTLRAYHDTKQGRLWIFLHSLLGYGADKHCLPGTFGAWNSDATEMSDYSHVALKDLGDYEEYGKTRSYLEMKNASEFTHPDLVMQRLCFANCMAENILAGILVRSRLRQGSSDYHVDNPGAIAGTKTFIESVMMEMLSGLNRKIASDGGQPCLHNLLHLDELTYQEWLKRSAEELVDWTEKQLSDVDDPDSISPECYSRQFNNLASWKKRYPEPVVRITGLQRKQYPRDFHNLNGKLNLGANSCSFPLISLTNGIISFCAEIIKLNHDYNKMKRCSVPK